MIKLLNSVNLHHLDVVKLSLRTCCTKVVRDLDKVDRRENSLHNELLYSSHLEQQALKLRKLLKLKSSKEYYTSREKHMKWLTEKVKHDIKVPIDVPKYPKKWMQDYEFYNENKIDEDNIFSLHGTSEPSILPSKVPCGGCGAHLHCTNPSLPGYIPCEIFLGRTSKELTTIMCQRCHFLKHYNIALDVEVAPDEYVKIISRIRDEFALAVVMVDLLDFPVSIWPGMQNLLGSKRPIFIVGNKVDLLPRDSRYSLEHIKSCLKQELVASGFDRLNIKYVSLISAKTGFGIEDLITELHRVWRYKGNVYLMGCTNVGKSSLFNILLNSDYCRPKASGAVRKATTCPWPGTTLQMLSFPILRPSDSRIYQRSSRLAAENIQKSRTKTLKPNEKKLAGDVGCTFKEHEDVLDPFGMSRGTQVIQTIDLRSAEYQEVKWCFDTPGVMQPHHVTNLLTTVELQKLTPRDIIRPRAFRLKEGMSIFLSGLARLDLIKYVGGKTDWIQICIFGSLGLPVTIVPTERAAEIYSAYLGTEILGLPQGTTERLARWPGLQCFPNDILVTGKATRGFTSDIVLSSTGWVGLSVAEGAECSFKAWTPHAHGIFMRTPALIPNVYRLIGKHIRDSFAYNVGKPFLKEIL